MTKTTYKDNSVLTGITRSVLKMKRIISWKCFLMTLLLKTNTFVATVNSFQNFFITNERFDRLNY